MTARSDVPSGRSPCIIGVGQVLSHSSDPGDTEPLELWARACTVALADAREWAWRRALLTAWRWSGATAGPTTRQRAGWPSGSASHRATWRIPHWEAANPNTSSTPCATPLRPDGWISASSSAGRRSTPLDVVTRAGEQPGWGHRGHVAPPPVHLDRLLPPQ